MCLCVCVCVCVCVRACVCVCQFVVSCQGRLDGETQSSFRCTDGCISESTKCADASRTLPWQSVVTDVPFVLFRSNDRNATTRREVGRFERKRGKRTVGHWHVRSHGRRLIHRPAPAVSSARRCRCTGAAWRRGGAAAWPTTKRWPRPAISSRKHPHFAPASAFYGDTDAVGCVVSMRRRAVLRRFPPLSLARSVLPCFVVFFFMERFLLFIGPAFYEIDSVNGSVTEFTESYWLLCPPVPALSPLGPSFMRQATCCD